MQKNYTMTLRLENGPHVRVDLGDVDRTLTLYRYVADHLDEMAGLVASVRPEGRAVRLEIRDPDGRPLGWDVIKQRAARIMAWVDIVMAEIGEGR